MFLQVSVCPQGGGGRAWQVFHKLSGVCMAGGHAWEECVGVCAWWEVCMARGACVVGHARGCQGGVHGRGACMGGMCGCVCMVGGVYGKGGMCGGACQGMSMAGGAWQGVCVAGRRACHAHPRLIPRLQHTVNEWAVRILLECILVYIVAYRWTSIPWFRRLCMGSLSMHFGQTNAWVT